MRFRRADRAVLVDQANGLEFVLADSGIRFDGANGEPLYSYYYLDTDAGPRYRCVALRELRYLTRNDREQDDILGRQWAAVRGLYNANVNFLYAAGGIFHPRHVGVVQWYGAMGEAESEEAAAEEALTGLGAVLALLANYPQSRTAAADAERLQWYLDFITHAPRVLVGLGHPDPRMSREGVGQDGASGVADDDLAREQTEMFLRALVSRRKQFIFHITADHVGRRRLADGLVTLARLPWAQTMVRLGYTPNQTELERVDSLFGFDDRTTGSPVGSPTRTSRPLLSWEEWLRRKGMTKADVRPRRRRRTSSPPPGQLALGLGV